MFSRLLYRAFPIALVASNWLAFRFTPTGRLLFWGLLAAAVFGVDTRQTLAYQFAALLLSALGVAIVLALRWRPDIAIRRSMPEYVTHGELASYTVTLTNRSSRTERDLVLRDVLREPHPSHAEFTRAKQDPRNLARNWFDRSVGFPRWMELLRELRGAILAPASLPALPPGQDVKVRFELRPLRRGHLYFSALILYRPDALGLFFAQHRVALPAHVIALPQRYPVPAIHLYSRRRYQQGGIHFALAVGDSQEFLSIRDYRPGDPRRHIHWRSFAKTGQPLVKQYQDEYFNRHALVVDTFLSAQPRESFEALVAVAASFAVASRPHDSLLDLIVVGDQVWRLTTGRGLADTTRVLRHLAEATPCAQDRFDSLRGYLRRHFHELASVVVVLGHWDDTRRALLDELNARQIPYRAMCLIPPGPGEQQAFDAAGMPAAGVTGVRVARIREDLARIDPGPR